MHSFVTCFVEITSFILEKNIFRIGMIIFIFSPFGYHFRLEKGRGPSFEQRGIFDYIFLQPTYFHKKDKFESKTWSIIDNWYLTLRYLCFLHLNSNDMKRSCSINPHWQCCCNFCKMTKAQNKMTKTHHIMSKEHHIPTKAHQKMTKAPHLKTKSASPKDKKHTTWRQKHPT